MSNREIKFRSQDENKNWRYFTLEDLISGMTQRMKLDNWCVTTGLYDKKGNEIFSGDIIGYWGRNPNGAKWIVGWDKNKSGFAAVYGETDLTNLGESMSGLPAFKLSKSLCEKKEILGNIYQNPELIKS